MNDIVSMRKMRPLLDTGASCGLGAGLGAACSGSAEMLTEDFFFGGNKKSLAVQREAWTWGGRHSSQIR